VSRRPNRQQREARRNVALVALPVAGVILAAMLARRAARTGRGRLILATLAAAVILAYVLH
jgi:hypothetical protein